MRVGILWMLLGIMIRTGDYATDWAWPVFLVGALFITIDQFISGRNGS